MSGFPGRIIRSILGPRLRDTAPVKDPEIHIPAASFNLAFHQIAGLNVTSLPRAVIVAEWTGSSFVTYYQEESWNTDRAQSRPVLARVTLGYYTYTFASSYLDESGASVPTNLLVARAASLKPPSTLPYPNGQRLNAQAWIDPSNPLVVGVQLWDIVGSGEDAKFWLEVG